VASLKSNGSKSQVSDLTSNSTGGITTDVSKDNSIASNNSRLLLSPIPLYMNITESEKLNSLIAKRKDDGSLKLSPSSGNNY
jgi:hypothetical protein